VLYIKDVQKLEIQNSSSPPLNEILEMTTPAPLVLPVGATENSVRVHPVVLYTICDAYIRRNDGAERVIGTLLGAVGDGIVEIKSCYAVPHSEGNEQVRYIALI
jgi:hypothetical protein